MLLQFPSEPLEFSALRQASRERFRARYRRPVIACFGPRAADVGVVVSSCERCGAPQTTAVGLGSLEDTLALPELEREARARLTALDPKLARCERCGGETRPVVALAARHLPALPADLELELIFGGGKVVRLERRLVDAAGERRLLADEPLALLEEVGAALSVRAVWQALVARHRHAAARVARRVEPGYVVGLRPWCTDPQHLAHLYADFADFMGELRAEADFDLVTSLRDREQDDIPVPPVESYHAWLKDAAEDIREGYLDLFVVADADVFVKRAAELAGTFGLALKRIGEREELLVRVQGQELTTTLNLAPTLFQTIHEGRTFAQGLARHLTRPLAALSEAAALPAALRERLPTHRVRVEGLSLELAPPLGHPARADLVSLATSFDFRSTGGMQALLRAMQAI